MSTRTTCCALILSLAACGDDAASSDTASDATTTADTSDATTPDDTSDATTSDDTSDATAPVDTTDATAPDDTNDASDGSDADVEVVVVTPTFFTFQAAAHVIGKPDFKTKTAPEVDARNIAGPWGSPGWLDGTLFLPDYDHHRVLAYVGVPDSDGAPADFVLGQATFDTELPGAGAGDMRGPETVRGHDGRLYVDDYGNSRILVWRELPTAYAEADYVIGKAGFDDGGDGGCFDNRLSGAEDLAFAGDALIVADSNNNRVLIWNTVPEGDDAPADVVLGQRSFTTCAFNDDDQDGDPDDDPSARTLQYPSGVWFDGQRLLVTDSDNNRVLGWNALPTQSGQPADFVIGQETMAGSQRGVGASHFAYPIYPGGDAEWLWLTDCDNHRVFGWRAPLTAARAPDVVLGQSDVDHIGYADDDQDGAEGPASARVFTAPAGVVMAGDKLIVNDADMGRFLVFEPQLCPPGWRPLSPDGVGGCFDAPCDPNPCGVGTCEEVDLQARCTCPRGTFGDHCDACDCDLGTCNDGGAGDGSCSCDAGAHGTRCDVCDDDHFGASCDACPACDGGCDDGRDGTGECVCANPHMGGAHCDTCAFGWQGAGCDEPFADCAAILDAQPAAPSRDYTIDVDGAGPLAPMTASCDMLTDGGGWTLVLDYVHAGGTNPELEPRNSDLPILSKAALGADESGLATWGHASSTLLAQMRVGQVRFDARTSAHDRVVDFATADADCVSYLSGHGGDCDDLAPVTLLPDHTAYLPLAADIGGHDKASPLTDFPFHSLDGFHLNVRASDGRWDVDDNAGSEANHTIHRVWVRPQCASGRAGNDCSIACASCVEGACVEGRTGDGTCACDDGYTGTTCASACPADASGVDCHPRATCAALHDEFPALPDGDYRIDPDGPAGALAPFVASCDMTTDGGGWTLVASYLHAALTNPGHIFRAADLPRRGSDTLGGDERMSAHWGHARPALLATLDPHELRFMCRSSGHARVLDFTTTSSPCLAYLTSGDGSCSDVPADFTPLADHDAHLPASTDSYYTDRGDMALTEFPFYQAGNAHWGIRGGNDRWECDDFAGGDDPPNATLHRVWVR